MKEWLMGLGAKRTPTDPDGSKHRLGFWAFCVAMLVLIAVLVGVRADAAEATTTVCRGPVSITNTVGTYSVTLTTNRWCGYRIVPPAGSAAWRFTDGGRPTFQRNYSEGPVWSFDRWLPTATEGNAVGTAPNGTQNVEYKAQWVAADFELCVGVPGTPAHVCYHSTDGVRIWAWANGNYTLKDNLGTAPRLPMPRP